MTEPDEVEEEYKKVIATLPQKQEESITKYYVYLTVEQRQKNFSTGWD